MLVFEENNNSTQTKTSGNKGENQQQTQPKYDADAGIWTLMKGECSQNCATLANHECAEAVFKKRRKAKTKTAFLYTFCAGKFA